MYLRITIGKLSYSDDLDSWSYFFRLAQQFLFEIDTFIISTLPLGRFPTNGWVLAIQIVLLGEMLISPSNAVELIIMIISFFIFLKRNVMLTCDFLGYLIYHLKDKILCFGYIYVV